MPANPHIDNLKKGEKNFTLGLTVDKVNELIDNKISGGTSEPKLKYIDSFIKFENYDYINVDLYRNEIYFGVTFIVTGNMSRRVNNESLSCKDIIPDKQVVYLVLTNDNFLQLKEIADIGKTEGEYIVGTIYSDPARKEIIQIDLPFDVRVNDQKLYNTPVSNNQYVKFVNAYCTNVSYITGDISYPIHSVAGMRCMKAQGYNYVLGRVGFTSDEVPVMAINNDLDSSQCVDENGESPNLKLSDIPYSTVLTYDFGVSKGPGFKGTKILTFKDFIRMCRNLGMHPYIELTIDQLLFSDDKLKKLTDTVCMYGIGGHSTWISDKKAYLEKIKAAIPSARLGFRAVSFMDRNSGTLSDTIMNTLLPLKTGGSDVFLYVNTGDLTGYVGNEPKKAGIRKSIEKLISNGIGLEVSNVENIDDIPKLPEYVSGITMMNPFPERYINKIDAQKQETI